MGRFNQCLTFYWLLALWENQSIQGFTIRPAFRQRPELMQIRFSSSSADDDEVELVPVRRQRRKPYYDNDEAEKEYYDDNRARPDYGKNNYEDEEMDEDYDEEEDDDDEEAEFVDALKSLEEVLDKWDPTEHPILGNEIVPNALLDNIDPDGSADRFPELAKDPRFWFDLFLMVIVLDILSVVGPQDTLPLMPSIN